MIQGVFRNASWSLAAKVVGAGGAYVLAWVVGRSSGGAVYGRFEVALTLVWIAAMVGRMGMDGAWVKHLPMWQAAERPRHELRHVYGRSVLAVFTLSAALGTLLWGIRGELAHAFQAEGLASDLRHAIWAVPGLALVGLAAEVLRAAEAFRGYALLQRGTLLLLTACGVAWWAGNPMPIFAGVAAGLALLALPLALGQIQGPTGPGDARFAFQSLRRTAFPMVATAAAYELMSWTDTLMLGAYLDELEVGRYRLAFRFAALLTLGQTALNSAMAPRMARASTDALGGMFRWAFRWNAAIAFGGFVGLVAFGPAVLAGFGADFAFSGSRLLLVVLAAGTAFNALSGPVLTAMNMTGGERQARNVVLIAALLNIPLNAWAIPRWGIAGAAAATGLTTVGWNVAAGVWVWQRYGIWPWWPFKRQAK